MKTFQTPLFQSINPPPQLNFLCLIIACFLLFNGQFLIAQEPFDDFCGTPPSEIPDPPGVYSKSVDPAYLVNFDPVSFNIFFWGLLMMMENGTAHQ